MLDQILFSAVLSLFLIKIIFSSTSESTAPFQVCAISSLTSGLSFSLLSNLKNLFFFLRVASKQVTMGLWSDASNLRYSHLPAKKMSNHWLFAMVLSRRHLTTLFPLTPLQERKSPEWDRSKRSQEEGKVMKSMKEPSGLVTPPDFLGFPWCRWSHLRGARECFC